MDSFPFGTEYHWNILHWHINIIGTLPIIGKVYYLITIETVNLWTMDTIWIFYNWHICNIDNNWQHLLLALKTIGKICVSSYKDWFRLVLAPVFTFETYGPWMKKVFSGTLQNLQCSASSVWCLMILTLSTLQKTLIHPYSHVTFPTNCPITPQYNSLIGYHQATHVITDHSCLSLAVNAFEIVNLFGVRFSFEQYTIFKYLQRYSYKSLSKF